MRKLTSPLATLVAATLAASASGCQAVASNSGAEPPQEKPSVAGLAIDALATDLKLPKESIQVESVTAIDWRDSSLGCPKPGMAYLDVITPGHKVMLSANGEVYAVHEANEKAFVCKQAGPANKMAVGSQLEYSRQMLTAQKDLANRLGVPVRDIQPAGAEKRTFDDASLGCPEAGIQYAQVETEGWVLTLQHGTRDYTYHADAHHQIPCPAITTE